MVVSDDKEKEKLSDFREGYQSGYAHAMDVISFIKSDINDIFIKSQNILNYLKEIE